MCIGGHLYGRCCRDSNKPAKEEKPQPVPLSGVIVNARIVDFVAEVTIHQRYENVEEVPIEATYVFPLSEGAAISNFYAIVEGKKIEGRIKEKEKAKDEYDDAIASGHSAYLLEEVAEKKNVFKTSIGNLPPKEEVVITIVYVTELAFTEDKKLELVIPTNTQAYPDGKQVPRFYQSTKQPKELNHFPFGLKVDVAFDMTSKIKSISSPSHPIEFTSGDSPNSAIVKLANQDDVGVPLVKNFEVRVALANPDSPVFRVQDGVGMLALYPHLLDDDEEPITEMIFLVDRSGSMSGAKIQKARDTLQIFLRSLPLGTLFNIVGFGGNFVSLFSNGSREYDEKTLQEATKHVNEIKADLGGTALLPPLKHIFSQPLRDGIPRQIFVLTDGEVDNTQECINFVREKSTIGRVFAFGIHGASPELVNGIAKAGEGKAEIISGNENIEGKVMIQLKRALQPALTDMRIDWGRLNAEQTPFMLPPLFSGNRLIAYGYISEKAEPDTVVFTANTYKGPIKFELPVTAEDLKPIKDGINFIPKLAARSMIRDLEEGRSSFSRSPGFSTEDAKRKTIELSIKSGMLSKFTAFIAVHENNKMIESEMQSRDVNKMTEKKTANIPTTRFSRRLLRASSSSSESSSSDEEVPHIQIKSAKKKNFSSRTTSTIATTTTTTKPGAVPRGRPKMKALSKTDEEEEVFVEKKKVEAKKDKKLAMKEKEEVGDRREKAKRFAAPQKEERELGAPKVASAKRQNAPHIINEAEKSPSLRMSSSSSTVVSKPQSTTTTTASAGSLQDLVLEQKAAGNFSEDALKLARGSIDKLQANVPDPLKAINAQLLDQILVTAFICGVLRTKFKDESDQWSLVEKKAMNWIKKEVKKISEELATNFDWYAFALKLAQL